VDLIIIIIIIKDIIQI